MKNYFSLRSESPGLPLPPSVSKFMLWCDFVVLTTVKANVRNPQSHTILGVNINLFIKCFSSLADQSKSFRLQATFNHALIQRFTLYNLSPLSALHPWPFKIISQANSCVFSQWEETGPPGGNL